MPSVPDQSPTSSPTGQETSPRSTTRKRPSRPSSKRRMPRRATRESYDASQIQVLEGLEAVRKRPGMYIGSTGERGLHHLVYEVVDNSVDEALAGHATHIEVTLLADGGVRVVDDGRGIPVDIVASEGKPAVEVVLTVLHAGGKFGGGGLPGLAVACTASASRWSTRCPAGSTSRSSRDGHVYRQSYTVGVPDGPLPKGEATEESGTTITFWASADVFDTIDFDFETLRTRFQQMAFLNKGLHHHADRRAAGDARRRGRQRADGDLPLRRTGWSTTSSTSTRRRRTTRSTRTSSTSSPRTRVPDDLGRDRACSGPRRTPRACTPTPTRSTPTRAAPTRRASGRR